VMNWRAALAPWRFSPGERRMRGIIEEGLRRNAGNKSRRS
jgi:hypothetical protein